MRKILFILFIGSLLLNSCSTGEKALQQGNYYEAIMKSAGRLSSDPDNSKAIQVVRDGYPMALTYYQEQIDRVLSSNDLFKWKQAYDIMLTVNRMSDEVRRIPAARKLVSTTKTYTSEMADVQSKAAQEMYNAGLDALSRKTREDAKQAFFHFQTAEDLMRGFKDAKQKMLESKNLATLKVVVEQIPVNGKYEYSAQFFYDNVFQMLNEKFQEKDFVHFYSTEEAEKTKLKYPDMVLRMGFYDFFIDRPSHFEEEKEIAKEVEEKYQVKDANGNPVTKTRMVPRRGKIKIVTDKMASGGLLELKAVEFQSQKIVFTDKIPGQFTWENKYGLFVGDKEVLDKDLERIVNNKVLTAPPSQDMFVLFTKPIFNQLSGKLISYFRQYN